jgi:hypothetical protein
MRRIWIPVWCLALSGPAGAAGPAALAGAEVGGDAVYTYAGVVAPLGRESRLGDGWFQRYWLDWLRYRYDAGGREVTARAPGGEAALGYQWPLTAGGLSASAGAVYRNTALTPSAADSAVKGGQWGLKLQGRGWWRRDQWHTAAIASYTLGTAGYWGRLRLYRARRPAWWPGVEAVALGDPEYDAVQLGALLGRIGLRADTQLTLKAGMRLGGGRDPAPYAGVELVWLPGGGG